MICRIPFGYTYATPNCPHVGYDINMGKHLQTEGRRTQEKQELRTLKDEQSTSCLPWQFICILLCFYVSCHRTMLWLMLGLCS